MEGDREELTSMAQKNKEEKLKQDRIEHREKIFDDSWALTMPKDELNPKEYSSSIQPQR